MTALQKGHLVSQRARSSVRRGLVAAATVCWEGGMVALSGSYFVPASANPALRVLGVALGNADNRLGGNGAVTVDYSRECTLMNNDASDPLAIADIGNACYASDDNTVAKTNAGGTKPQAGTVYDIDPSGGVWVRFA